jgi:hypothetical protein
MILSASYILISTFQVSIFALRAQKNLMVPFGTKITPKRRENFNVRLTPQPASQNRSMGLKMRFVKILNIMSDSELFWRR